MSPVPSADAIVVGSGPNGLAAAITLARAGLKVQLIEGADTPGGGCRTAELTLPGFQHDVCSAVHPLAASSPFFTSIDLAARGVTLRTPKVAFAHPQDGGRAAAVAGSVEETAGSLGRDAGAYRRLLGPLVREVGLTLPEILAPIRSVPQHPLAMARFGLDGLPPATILARRFHTEEAQGLLAGVAAHSMLPLSAPVTSAFGLLLTMAAHAVGWPVVEGGSARLTDALLAELTSLGGEVETGHWVRSLDELPLPSRLGATRTGGIDLNKPRIRAALAAALALAAAPHGFTVAQFTARAQHLRIGLVQEVVPAGAHAPILAGVRSPRRARKPTHWTRIDRDYETLRIGMQGLFNDLGITASTAAAA